MADEQLNEKDLNVEETGAGNAADARVLELEEQLAAAKDQALRAVADVQNARRRAEQDVEKAHKFALEKFSGDLLPVIDSPNWPLAHSSADDEHVKQIREGVELTLKMFGTPSSATTSKQSTRTASRSTRSTTRPWPCRKTPK